jgi:hypothetical protein
LGWVLTGSADAGLVAGAGANVSVGGGFFIDNSNYDVSPGLYAAGGGFAGGPKHSVSFPCSDQPPWAFGASAGIGRGAFLTNANNVTELRGPFDQYNLNLPFVSISLGISGSTWIVSGSIGPSGGISVSGYSTTTVTTPSFDPNALPASPNNDPDDHIQIR